MAPWNGPNDEGEYRGELVTARCQGIVYPSSEMQSKLMKSVYRDAGVDPTDVAFVELHATGTLIGDRQEANSVTDVFCTERRSGPLLIGSVKTNMGHSEISSGLSSLMKLIIAMQEHTIPPNLHFNIPSPEIPGLFDGRLKVITAVTTFVGRGGYRPAYLCYFWDTITMQHISVL